VKLASVLKSTLCGKLFQTLTIRSQKNFARTVAVEWFLCSLKLTSGDGQRDLLKEIARNQRADSNTPAPCHVWI